MAWLEIFRFLHLIGLAFGLGGATAAAIISAKADKNPDIAAASMKIASSMSKLIWLGITLLIISGIGISLFIQWPVNRQLLLIKHILVAWIVAIGIIIGINIKKLKELAPKPKESQSHEFLRVKKLVKIFGIINLILWYLVTILSVFL